MRECKTPPNGMVVCSTKKKKTRISNFMWASSPSSPFPLLLVRDFEDSSPKLKYCAGIFFFFSFDHINLRALAYFKFTELENFICWLILSNNNNGQTPAPPNELLLYFEAREYPPRTGTVRNCLF